MQNWIKKFQVHNITPQFQCYEHTTCHQWKYIVGVCEVGRAAEHPL